jgi:hypothetical protein
MNVIAKIPCDKPFNGMHFFEYVFDSGHIFTLYESGSYTARTLTGRKAMIHKRKEMQNAIAAFEKQRKAA